MPYKKTNHEAFYFTSSNGQQYSFYCWYQNTRYGFRHGCDVLDEYARPVVSVSCPYYNRTWERFRYESALIKAARKLPTEHQEEIRAWIQDIGDGIAGNCRRQVQEFKQEYAKLPDSMKEAVSTMPLETPEDADRMCATVKAFNLITGR